MVGVTTDDPESVASAGPADASAEAPAEAPERSPASSVPPSRATVPPSPSTGGSNRWWWLLAVAILVEFWLFGHRGEVQVCVGKTGIHDFALVGQTRDDTNRWNFPRCEERLNLGLDSELRAQVADATQSACRGATMFRHRGEASACAEGTQGWEHRVSTSFVPPWDARYRERLLWFFYR